MRYALKLFYLGRYEGFQRQTKKETIEGYLEIALKNAGLIENLTSAVYASAGRTDKGVHALSQVVAISTSEKLIIPAINSYLPKNIVIWAASVVNDKFHPRYEAISRYYRYYTLYSNEDIDLMREGAKILEGIHNFKLFSKKNPEKYTIKEIYQIGIEKKELILIFHIIANSFLWQMVRRLIDSLLKIGQSQWKLEDLKDLLNGIPKSNIYTTPLPINGSGALILWDVEYLFQFQPYIKSVNQIKTLLRDFLVNFSLKSASFKEFYNFFNMFSNKQK
ncbi:MAG: tRNA pseudouridine(38-40) synthase TruA [Promethearchaeota archaeon]